MAGIASQTYRATVSGLLLLDAGRAPADGPPGSRGRPTPSPRSSTVARAGCDAAADLLDTGREIHVLADALHSGLAEQAALMFREAPRIAAMPFDTGDWLHVGQYTLFPGDGVLLFAGSPADDEAIATIRRRGGRVVLAGSAHDGAHLVVPVSPDPGDWVVGMLVASAVAELVAAEIWRRVTGIDKGMPDLHG